jgi:hypothetical protein
VFRRTRFYDRSNVLSLRIERKRRRLRQRKAERDKAMARLARLETDRDYRAGLMIDVRNAPLTDAELELCAELRAWPLDEGVPHAKVKALYEIITRLLRNPEAVVMMTIEADELVGGGTAMRKAG